MSRFAQSAGINQPDGIAALALLRAMTAQLLIKGVLSDADVGVMRELALEEVGDLSHEGAAEACRLLREQFP